MGKRLGYLLIALLLGIEIPRFFGTYGGIDPALFGLPLTAIATGIVLPVGSMYVFHTWWTAAWNKRHRNVLLVWFGANLALSGFILIPWGMARLRDLPLSQVVAGWWAWTWVGAVMLSPFVLMGGITTALAFQRGMRTETREAKAEPVPAEPATIPLDPMSQDILREWQADPERTMAQVGLAVGASKSTVSRRFQALQAEGLVSRTDQGVVVKWRDNGRER